jgi:hypothetical protein
MELISIARSENQHPGNELVAWNRHFKQVSHPELGGMSIGTMSNGSGRVIAV